MATVASDDAIVVPDPRETVAARVHPREGADESPAHDHRGVLARAYARAVLHVADERQRLRELRLVDRDGAHVRPDHTDRHERHPDGRRRARVRALQHVAADRRRARARRPVDVLGEQDRRRALEPRPPPQQADQAQALVDGFQSPYLGSALLVAAAAILLALLLRREDVVAVGEGAMAAEPSVA